MHQFLDIYMLAYPSYPCNTSRQRRYLLPLNTSISPHEPASASNPVHFCNSVSFLFMFKLSQNIQDKTLLHLQHQTQTGKTAAATTTRSQRRHGKLPRRTPVVTSYLCFENSGSRQVNKLKHRNCLLHLKQHIHEENKLLKKVM